MTYFLGIDGGGTKTTCAVGDDTHVLATAIAGPSNVVRVGETEARESLHRSVRQACAAAGISPEQVSRTCVGAAGAGRPDLAATVRGFLTEILASPIDVVGDMETALEAAFDTGPGVVVNAGTGSFAYGRDERGRTLRAGGWGFAIGDEASAHWIGRSAVIAVLRAADEGRADSALAQALLKSWGTNSVLDLARRGNAVPPPDFASLFPAVVNSGDDLSGHILATAGRELARLAALVMKRLFAVDESIQVAITGGVFRHSQVVRDTFYNKLPNLDRRARLMEQLIEPVVGALQLARRRARG